MGFATLYLLSKKELFASGFIISILWFWWVGYSFVYYELTFLIPVVLSSIGLLYGFLFYFIGLSKNVFYKTGYIFLLSFINPFGFNWFKLELPFINSYLGTSKFEFFLILISIALFFKFRDKYKKISYILVITSFICLFFFNYFNQQNVEKPKLKITQYQTHIDQKEKWNKRYKKTIVNDNFMAIKKAINENQDLIILPETAFPLVLNNSSQVNRKLLELSYHISILTGALYQKDGLYYNSTYLYDNGKVKVSHKVVLVPFGESIPFPEKIKKFLNDIFYDGAADYETAKNPTTFTIKGTKFRSAICFEATTDTIYKNLDTPYVIVISNNAWFTPSIQPVLQSLLLKYYKNKYNLYYLNTTNY
jgi:apolipoprotein N-acyltransferase